MEGARVVIIEDKDYLRDIMREVLESNDHIVSGEAATLGEAFTVIDEIESGTVACDVLCVDGSLGTGESSVEDGRAIVEDVRHRKLPVTLISFSGNLLRTEFGINVDREVRKPAISDLVNTIEQLPNRTQ